MRNTVASRYDGHPFEKRFLDLDPIQLKILYEQAMLDKKNELQDKFDTIKTLNEFWVDNFNILFKNLMLFTNPELYGRVEELKNIEGLREDINEEQFPEEWEKLMSFLPEEVVVADIVEDPMASLPTVSAEMEEMITGWESQSKFTPMREE